MCVCVHVCGCANALFVSKHTVYCEERCEAIMNEYMRHIHFIDQALAHARILSGGQELGNRRDERSTYTSKHM